MISLLRPAIALTATRTEDAQIPVGASKFGGAPDVPAEFEWPLWNEEPLGFLAQINLEEVAAFDVEGLLPKTGMLSFFMGMREGYDWVYSNDDVGGWHVFHLDALEDISGRAYPSGFEKEISIKSASLSFQPSWTWTDWFDFAEEVLSEMSAEEVAALYELEKAWKVVFSYIHQMLGHPDLIQDDPRYVIAGFTKRGSTQEWQLLLQIDSDNEIDFDYCCGGRVWFVAHRDDLKSADFSRVGFEGQQ